MKLSTYALWAILAVMPILPMACSSADDEPEAPESEEPTNSDSDSDQEADNDYDDKYLIGQLIINTAGGAAITSKEEYVDATVSLTHSNSEWNLSDVSAGIRGRGNSTWLWYPKKPYRIKFENKQPMLGLDKAKSWVLLAEYRDPTDLMNTFVFELGRLMGLPYTNHNRYVWLTLNGESMGLYHLTEQVQQNKARVNIDEQNGYLISLDKDDGPDLSPGTGDNFWSSVYQMPVCIKNPDELTESVISSVKSSLAELESAIRQSNYSLVCSLLDIDSMIDFVMVQEIIYNVELDAPRSMYMYKDVGEKWVMGPLWDFDGGFDFDWNNMTKSHDYFASYSELVLGTDPVNHIGTSYRVPGFFSDLFKMKDFVSAYKKRWKEVRPMMGQAMDESLKYYEANVDAWDQEAALWPISKTPSRQIELMVGWLNSRMVYLDNIIASYPAGTY